MKIDFLNLSGYTLILGIVYLIGTYLLEWFFGFNFYSGLLFFLFFFLLFLSFSGIFNGVIYQPLGVKATGAVARILGVLYLLFLISISIFIVASINHYEVPSWSGSFLLSCVILIGMFQIFNLFFDGKNR